MFCRHWSLSLIYITYLILENHWKSNVERNTKSIGRIYNLLISALLIRRKFLHYISYIWINGNWKHAWTIKRNKISKWAVIYFCIFENNCEHICIILKKILIINIFKGIVGFRFDIDCGGLFERDKFDKIVIRIVTYCSYFLRSSDRSNLKTRLSSRGFFFLLVPAARNYQFRVSALCFCYFSRSAFASIKERYFWAGQCFRSRSSSVPRNKGVRFHAFAPMFPE